MEDEIELFICGTRGSHPQADPEFLEFGGATVCNIVRRGNDAVVMDCGSGFYRARDILRRCKRIDVVISHMHYDHLIGLLDYSVFPTEAEVRFISNFDRWYGQETLQRFMRPPFWPYTPPFGVLRGVLPPQNMLLCGGMAAEFYPSSHPDEAVLIRLDVGGRRLSFICDYEHGHIDLGDWIRGSDWLIYDGTYTPKEYRAHMTWGHSTWEQGCELARSCGVERLLITHHGTDHTDEQLRAEEVRAKARFPGVCFARQGQRFII